MRQQKEIVPNSEFIVLCIIFVGIIYNQLTVSMRHFLIAFRSLCLFLLMFAIAQKGFSQSKLLIKANKAFHQKKWSKFNRLSEKINKKDSISLDVSYLNYLNFSPSSPNFQAEKNYECAFKFDSSRSQLPLKQIQSFDQKLKLRYDRQNVVDSALARFLNQLLLQNDSHKIQEFILKFKDEKSIPTVQQFISHYIQKYISVESNKTIQILEIKQAWHEAFLQKELNAILMFRDKYPQSFCDELAYHLEAKYAFLQALKINSIEEFNYIKQKYSNTQFAVSADSAIAEIQFNQLSNKYKIQDLKKFNAEYKNTRLNNLVANRLIGLEKMDSVIQVVNAQLVGREPQIPSHVKIDLESITIQFKQSYRFDVKRKDGRKFIYSYVQYLPFFNGHILKASDYEKDEFVFVNEKSGKKVDLKGKPLFCMRIDSTVQLVTENLQKNAAIGFEILTSTSHNHSLKPVFTQIFDSSDNSQLLDKINIEDGKILSKISDFIAKSSLTVPIGTQEFKYIDSQWVKSVFYPEIGDFQKPITKDFVDYWIKMKMPLFNLNGFNSFYRYNDSQQLIKLAEKPEGVFFPIAVKQIGNSHLITCISNPLKGNAFSNIEKYIQLGNDKDFVYIELESAIQQNELTAFPPSFNPNQLFLTAYALGLFQLQYPNSMVDEVFCNLLNKNYLGLDQEITKPVFRNWAINFVQYRMSVEPLFEDILRMPLNFTFKVKLEEYNLNNQSFTVRGDKNLEPELSFANQLNLDHQLIKEMKAMKSICPITSMSVEHTPTMVFNKGSETDFTIHVKEMDAAKVLKMKDKDQSIYMRIKITPMTKALGKECKVCINGTCDEYKLRNCKISFQADQYEFSANPDFKQSLILKQ